MSGKRPKRMAAISAVSKITGDVARMEADKRKMARNKKKTTEGKKRCKKPKGPQCVGWELALKITSGLENKFALHGKLHRPMQRLQKDLNTDLWKYLTLCMLQNL